jgi:hypothetical protein
VGDDTFSQVGVRQGAFGYRLRGHAGEVVIVPGVTGGHGFRGVAVGLSVKQGRFFPEGAFGSEGLDGRAADGTAEGFAEIGENFVSFLGPVIGEAPSSIRTEGAM